MWRHLRRRVALACGIVIDGFKPDLYDHLGATTICLVGFAVTVFAPRP